MVVHICTRIGVHVITIGSFGRRLRSSSGFGLRTDPVFAACCRDLLQLLKGHQFHPHAYADGFCRPSQADELSSRVSACNVDVSAWMRASRLQLNPSKTEVLCCSLACRHCTRSRPTQFKSTTRLFCRSPLFGILASTSMLTSP